MIASAKILTYGTAIILNEAKKCPNTSHPDIHLHMLLLLLKRIIGTIFPITDLAEHVYSQRKCKE